MELIDFTELVRNTEFAVFRSAVESGGAVEGICVPGGAVILPPRDRRADRDRARRWAPAASSLLPSRPNRAPRPRSEIRSPVLKFLGLELARAIGINAGAGAGDLVLIVAGAGRHARQGAGLRRHGSSRRWTRCGAPSRPSSSSPTPTRSPSSGSSTSRCSSGDDEEERWDPAHHLFTSAKPEDSAMLEHATPARVRSNAYDIVCNGQEIGGGSIRIHDRAEQETHPPPAQDRGRGRRTSASVTCWRRSSTARRRTAASPAASTAPRRCWPGATTSARSSPFPKTKSASDPMTGAPSRASEEALRMLNIAVTATRPDDQRQTQT